MSQLSGKVQREILVPQLKEILRRHGLPTSGNKAELIQRLDENFPNRAWENETSAGETEQEGNVEEDKTPLNNSILRVDAPSWHPDEMSRKVTELLERERELMAREIELLRRENELLRNSPSSTASSTTNTNIRSIGELISDFSGEEQNFKNWSKQLEILSTTYELDENATRLLLGQKLKGRALNWFHSRSEHLELPTDMLLYRMESMFGNRETKVELKKKFESRKWRNTEPFEHYYHEKIVLANKVPVPEDELVEYLIDGIPDNGIQNQARMCEFKTSSHMLKALRRISLPNGSRNYTRSTAEKNQQGPNTTRGSPSGSRCYNCNRVGHRAADCRLPAREKGSCFGCGEMGHLLPNCPKKNVTRVPKRQVTYTEMEIPEEDDYHKNVQYVMNEKCMILYTLIDSGSPVSFIKRSYVPGRIENIQNSNGVRLVGINKSPLGLLGTVEASVELSKDTKETMTLLVVPDQTMYTPVVLGRDALRLFAMNIVQTKRDPISQLEILNIIKEKNGELRMCVDFRELNKILVRDNYPLPLIEDHLDIVGGKKYFSLIDLKDGFFHVHMAKDSCKYTSFVTPLELIRSGDVVVYMDDILIATQTIEHHLQILNRVFTLLVDNKMEMRLDKCKFLYNEIEYLGYLITEKGLSPPKTGIQAVENFPIPRGVREGIKFKILTDCNSLRLTLNKKEINPRIARWALELQNYDFEIEHRPGIRMMHADALSRSTNILIIPETMVSDRGSCFTSKDFEDFMNKNNIRHAKVATASPQANGQVERVNRVLGPSLAKLTENCPGKRWYEVLEDIEYALNNTISKSVSETPSKLLFGVDQRGKTPDNLKGYIHEWTSRKPVDLNACRRNAAENNIRAQNYNKAYFDKKHKPPYTYTTGDYIMLRNFESTPGVSQKLLPKYKGPYEITKCLAGAAKLSGWPSCKGFEGLRPMRTAAEYRRPVRDAVYVYGSYVDDEEGAIEVATYPYLAAFSRAYMRLKASRDWSPKKRPPTSKNDITSRRRKDAVVVRIARTT
ncbi:uncharacterized protein LOC143363643 [Halictus rubicundus]|uniref:uncharacterized protein LOC143363643 n=1 Tax=Halictus rubicundus TaxID=77578 RepID=UPI004036418C